MQKVRLADLIMGGKSEVGEVAMKTDTELQQDVMNELKWEPTIRAAEIGVGVTDGVVTLSGNVDSFYEKWAAERAVARVFGVKAVAEELKVRLPGSFKDPDCKINCIVGRHSTLLDSLRHFGYCSNNHRCFRYKGLP